MFIVNSYLLAVVFCFITMLCWGSWGNTQKLAAKSWRYELFYWDYVIGMVLFALLIAFTMGSCGTEGRPFLEDIAQVSGKAVGSIILGGVIFNASNILLSASTSIAGMAVAFPLGVGISLVLGTIVNYIGAPAGNPVLLFIGVALIPLFINNICQRKPLPVYGKGENVRDWLYVEDHAKAIDLIFHKGKTAETYNIGGFNEWKNIDLIKVMIRTVDRILGNPEGHSLDLITYVTDRLGHDARYAIDSTKLQKELGWEPSLQFEEGIEKTVRWYLNNREWMDNVTSG